MEVSNSTFDISFLSRDIPEELLRFHGDGAKKITINSLGKDGLYNFFISTGYCSGITGKEEHARKGGVHESTH